MASSSNPIRLLLLIPNLGLGGAQRVFADHARLLAGLYDVTECVFNLDNSGDYHTLNDLYELKVSGGGGPLAKAQNFIIRCTKLRRLKQTRRISISISHLEGADYVNVLSNAGEYKVLCVHGSKLHDRNINGVLGWLRLRVFIPLLYRRAHRIVTVSAGIRDELVNELGIPASKVQVINNFFDAEIINKQAAITPPEPYAEVLANYPVLATVGRFAPEKNLLVLLNLFAQVKKCVPQSKLLLVGQGEQYQELLDRCRTLELSVYTPEQPIENSHGAAVLLTGFQSNPHAFIARCTVFVLPSLNEGFPMALGEAMICGIPVVAADCPTGPREMLAPNTISPKTPLSRLERAKYGLLLPVINNANTRASDEQAWVNTLTELLADAAERKRLGQLARARMQDFTEKRIFGQWMQLVEEVCLG